MLSPLHFLPDPLRSWIFLIGGGLWFSLFAFGTARFAVQREWDSAAFCGLLTLFLGLGVLGSILRLRDLRTNSSRLAGGPERDPNNDTPIE